MINLLKNTYRSVYSWIGNNKLKALVLLGILFLAAFLRLYRIDEYLTFLGDEGRDAIVVRRLLVNFDPILVGPGTSIGNMYLGPLYYYMMAPALLLASFSPVGPAAMIALLGVATVAFTWIVAKEWFGDWAGIVAAILFATSPVVIVYSRSSWNPNIMPFFSLLTIYSIWKMWKEKSWKWMIVASVAMAFVLQSHYLGLLLVPVVGLFWFLTFWKFARESFKRFIGITLISLAAFASLMSPLVVFDARHGWRNFQAMKKFFTQRQTTVSARPWTALPKLDEIIYETSERLVAGTNKEAGVWVVWIVGALLLWLAATRLGKIKSSKRKAFFLLGVWLFTAFIGLGVYKQEVYDHYYGFFFTAPFLLIGGLAQEVIDAKKRLGIILTALFSGFILFLNFSETPIKYEPANQLKRSRVVANKIIKESENEKFNIAVIAERNYEGAYQYFLEKNEANLKLIDPQLADETVGKYLFVVCELPEEKCDPVNNPKAEVANFGWSKILEKWSIEGVTLYKLGHNI